MSVNVRRLIVLASAGFCVLASAPSLAQPPVHVQQYRPLPATPQTPTDPTPAARPEVPTAAGRAQTITEAEYATPTTATPDARSILSPPAPESVKEKQVAQRPPRPVVTHLLEAGSGGPAPEPIIGSSEVRVLQAGDTFLDIARNYDLGYNEIVGANRNVDPWIPKIGAELLVPTEWILPRAPHEGIVVNIPEMRLYYYVPSPRSGVGSSSVITYPVGLGRQDWQTPQAEFRVRGKTRNPVWNIPESIKAERIEKNGFTEDSIPGGSPDNPLGLFRIELTLPMYTIHSTNREWGVGMQVSHGCIRLYPEDIEAFFPLVQIGVPGRFVYQPIKIGVREGRVLVEVHEDIYGVAPWPWMLAQDLVKELGLERQVDRERLEAAVEAASGVPTDVSHVKWPDFDGGKPVRFDEKGDPIDGYPVAAGTP
jgi:L,D-transpeptidase ErfK/SrfK